MITGSPVAAAGAVAAAPVAVQRQGVTTAEAAARADVAANQADAATRQAQDASQQAGDAMAQANAAMDEAKLASLRTVATGRINLAYTAYVSACRDVRDAIKSAAKQNAEMMTLVLDVAMGFATPRLARWVVGFANRIPVESSTAAYRIAMTALDGDRVKAVLTGATKAANQTLKSAAMALAGETDVDAFVGSLERHTQQSFQSIIDALPGKGAVEVGIIASAFDSSVANHDVYRLEIKSLCDLYQRDVSPIAEPTMTESLPAEAVWVKDGAATRLAIVTYQPGFLGAWGNRYFLDSWVDPQMQSLALGKQMSKYGRIETIEKDQLR